MLWQPLGWLCHSKKLTIKSAGADGACTFYEFAGTEKGGHLLYAA